MRNRWKSALWFATVLPAVFAITSPAFAATDTLKVYLLTGQSNMVGHAYTHLEAGNQYKIPTLEFLLDSPDYVDRLPEETYTFKNSLDESWMSPRDDVWGVHYLSRDLKLQQVEPTPSNNQGAWSTSIMPLSPGFGGSGSMSSFGPELGMGIHLGDAMQSPVFLFKSCTGGTTLAEDWRSPLAVINRGGSAGVHFTNTINQFRLFLNDLDADLADDGLLEDYGNATGYEVAGFVWFQGWNEKFNDGAGEYAQNIVDLVRNVRRSDRRIPDDLGVIIPESSDQDAALNAGRVQAVEILNAEIPGSAVFFENNGMIGDVWRNSDDRSRNNFTDAYGYHFHSRAENYLQIGWRTGQAVIESGFTGTEVVPEPSTFVLAALAAVMGLGAWRRRCRGRR